MLVLVTLLGVLQLTAQKARGQAQPLTAGQQQLAPQAAVLVPVLPQSFAYVMVAPMVALAAPLVRGLVLRAGL